MSNITPLNTNKMPQDDRIPEIDILWWDSSSFCIRCPYCDKLHPHPHFSSIIPDTKKIKFHENFLELSECLPRRFYRCKFPFEERGGKIAYEIDKNNTRFVTIYPKPEKVTEDLDDLVNQFSEKVTLSPTSNSKIVYGNPPTLLGVKDYTFKRFVSLGEPSITLRAPIANYTISNEWKTIARLERGKPFPSIMAMSGWVHPASGERIGGDWTYYVMDIAKLVGHILAEDPNKDQDECGRFNASHAEKQLTAYFLNRHVFLSGEKQHDRKEESLVVDIDKNLEEILWKSKKVQELRKLEQSWETLVYELRKLEGSWTRLIAELRRMDKKWERQALGLGDTEINARILQNKSMIQKLELDIKTVQTQLWRILVAPPADMPSLEEHAEVREFRKLQRELREIKKRRIAHQKLIDLSKNAPPVSLKSAVILISSPGARICSDCSSFLKKVNEYFGLSIEYHECTEK